MKTEKTIVANTNQQWLTVTSVFATYTEISCATASKRMFQGLTLPILYPCLPDFGTAFSTLCFGMGICWSLRCVHDVLTVPLKRALPLLFQLSQQEYLDLLRIGMLLRITSRTLIASIWSSTITFLSGSGKASAKWNESILMQKIKLWSFPHTRPTLCIRWKSSQNWNVFVFVHDLQWLSFQYEEATKVKKKTTLAKNLPFSRRTRMH